MRDGTNLGFVTDIEFETCEGRIVALVVGDCPSLGLSKTEEVVIPWCKIVRIGDDVILVDIVIDECRCSCNYPDKQNKTGFFFLMRRTCRALQRQKNDSYFCLCRIPEKTTACGIVLYTPPKMAGKP